MWPLNLSTEGHPHTITYLIITSWVCQWPWIYFFSRCKSMRYKCILFSMHNLIRTCFPFPIHVPNRNGEYMFPQSTFTFKHNVTSSCLMKHIEGTHKNFWENFLVSLEVLCQTVYRDIIILHQRYYFCCK